MILIYGKVLNFTLGPSAEQKKAWLFDFKTLKVILSSFLFQIFFGTFQARIYLVADLLKINCHTGMSALIRKSAIDEVGGLQTFGCYLAEDFFYAKSLTDRGYKACVSSQPAWQNSGFCEITSFQNRLMR